MKHTNNQIDTHIDIKLTDIPKEELHILAELVSTWQQDPDFMRFLKETPMTPEENLAFFKKKLESEKVILKCITDETASQIVGFILFHNPDPTDDSLEISFRVDPTLQRRGVCTHGVKMALMDAFAVPGVEKIIGWHSAWNRGSFNVFKKSGFQIEKFVPEQTFLPNIGKITDDFKWELHGNLLLPPPLTTGVSPINKHNADQIIAGLQKHGLK